MAICRAWVALLFYSCMTPSVYSAHLALSCGTVGQELETCRTGAMNWAKATHHEVEILASPSSAGERLSQMQLLLAAKSSDIDIFLVDTTWPGVLSEFFIDLRLDENIRREIPQFFDSFIKNNQVHGKLLALPWFIDAGLLYYRKDLLNEAGEIKPPQTWEALTRIAKKIQDQQRKAGHPRFWGFVFQGRAYEGLTCNGLEWLKGLGLDIINPSTGQVTLRDPRIAEMMRLAASWIGSISPRGVLNFMEEESRGVFQSGNAAFMRNWPYAWKLANSADSPVRGKVAVTALPGNAAILGGWSLAVSRYSKSPKEAIQLIRYLTSPSEQKRRTLALGQNPTLPSLYRDPELLKDNPQLPLFLNVFEHATSRPSSITGARYHRVSAEFWDTLHEILSGKSEINSALGSLEKKLDFLSRGGQW